MRALGKIAYTIHLRTPTATDSFSLFFRHRDVIIRLCVDGEVGRESIALRKSKLTAKSRRPGQKKERDVRAATWAASSKFRQTRVFGSSPICIVIIQSSCGCQNVKYVALRTRTHGLHIFTFGKMKETSL